MRPATACLSCRSGKRKCRIKFGHDSCVRCNDFGLLCSLHPSATSGGLAQVLVRADRQNGSIKSRDDANSRDHSCSLSPGSDDHANDELCKELVWFYFKFIHDTHHSLFHQASIEEDLDMGTLPDVFLYSMMALGARFSDNSLLRHINRRDRGTEYAEKALKSLDITDISITTIQACVLLGTLCYAEAKMEAEALYYAIANRLALIMDLPRRPAASEVERQINLRTWWTLYMIDNWSSMGLYLPQQLSYAGQVPLPAEESFFFSLSHKSGHVDAPTTTGIWGVMTRLARLWSEIHDLNKASVEGALDPQSLNSAVAELSQKLDNWSTSLPSHLKETPENLRAFASQGMGPSFAALHLGYHYFNEVLFYQFLAGDYGDLNTAFYAEKCTTHALSFCDLLYTAYVTPGCECFFIMAGHLIVVTSTVYIHILLFSRREDQICLARKRLEQNFEILTELQSYWRTLDMSLARLKSFHSVCRASIERSFRMDRWMLRFILEYGNSLPDRFCEVKALGRPGEAGTGTDGSEAGVSPTTLQGWYSETFSKSN